MELLKLPEQAMSMLFGPQSMFANWVTFFIANWLVISLGGFILSNWMSKKPDGIIDRNSLAAKISEKSNWFMPFAILGIALSFIYNVFIYSVFFVLEVTRFMSDFLFKWIKFLFFWIWENVVSPSIWMLLKLAYHYLIKMPFHSLLGVIRSVPSVLNRAFYHRVLWPSFIGSVLAAILMFIAFMANNNAISEYGTLVIAALTLTWIVSEHIYGTREAAVKSVLFTLVLCGFAIAIVGILYFLNKGDASIKWGGTFAGILHVPTIVGILVAGLIALSLLFSSSIGVIYSNTTQEKNWVEKIRVFFVESFKRSLSFCYQYLFVAIIGTIITLLPIAVLKMVSDQAGKSIVQVHLDDKLEQLNKDLKVYTTSDEKDLLMNADSTKENAFSTELDSLKQESELNYKLGENKLFTSFISDAGTFGTDLSPVNTRKEFDGRVEASEKFSKELEDSKKEEIKNLDESIKTYNVQIDEAKRALTEILVNPLASNYYTELITSMSIELKKIQVLRERTIKYDDVLITAAKANTESLKGNWSSYATSYLFYLVSKYALFSLIVAFFFALFALTVQPTYDSYKGSGLVAAFEDEKSKNANQPWLAFILLGALAVGVMNPNKVMDEPLKWVDSLVNEVTVTDSKGDNEASNRDSTEENANVSDAVQDDVVVTDNSTAPDAAISEAPQEYYYCNDGESIPLAFYNDGGCDCSNCEDEN